MSNGFEILRTIHMKFMLSFSIAVYEHKYFLVMLKPKICHLIRSSKQRFVLGIWISDEMTLFDKLRD